MTRSGSGSHCVTQGNRKKADGTGACVSGVVVVVVCRETADMVIMTTTRGGVKLARDARTSPHCAATHNCDILPPCSLDLSLGGQEKAPYPPFVPPLRPLPSRLPQAAGPPPLALSPLMPTPEAPVPTHTTLTLHAPPCCTHPPS